MTTEKRWNDLMNKLDVLYSLQDEFGGRTLDNVVKNLEASAKCLEDEMKKEKN